MKITFWIKYHTVFGEQIFLTSEHSFCKHKPIPLQYFNEDFWCITLPFVEDDIVNETIAYYYYVTKNETIIAVDNKHDKTFNPSKYKSSVQIVDSWNNSYDAENIFFTKPFKDFLLKNNAPQLSNKPAKKYTHTFKVKAPLLQKNQTLCIVGNIDELNNWNIEKPLLLQKDAENMYYTVQVNIQASTTMIEYKYGVYDTVKKTFIHYEEGKNRVLYDATINSKNVFINDGFAVLPSITWKGAGVAIPVFSIRTNNSFGVGEFLDIQLLADWAEQTDIKLIQLLPINDTTVTHSWQDSYPYAAISAFALHPIYLNIETLLTDATKKLQLKYKTEKNKLNKHTTLQYETVVKAKWKYIQQIYTTQRDTLFSSTEYKNFFHQNKHWLIPYAAFCYLRDEYGTANFYEWILYKKYKEEDIIALTKENTAAYYDIAIHYFVQYHLHKQLKQAVNYAHKKSVVLKGDLPIGVHKYSAEVWQQPHLFNEHLQAGAPPDAFAVKGQNWGFPTYNWEKMKATNFYWWQQRLVQMNEYFDAFRIDHILGFFRIWSIPAHAIEGIMGYFVPALPIRKNELIEKGLHNNLKRFTKPFITDAILQALFGVNKTFVIENYVQKNDDNTYSLKETYATQIQVEKAFEALPKNELNNKIKLGLFDIISNVILFEIDNSKGEAFHFRFDMGTTFSYQQLDEHTQQQLKELYIDYFFHRQNELWKSEAYQKLPILKELTNMMICGEDLGLVPNVVPEVMKTLAIASLEVQRMPKTFDKKFSYPNDAPYISVVTPATHDMSTIRGWWKEDKNITQTFFNSVLLQKGKAPENCEAWINKAIIEQHLYSSAIWSIFQLQDLLGADEDIRRENVDEERINIPANPYHHWCYRMHITVETLIEQKQFNTALKKIIQLSGR
ncbi:MAG: 4-alpha-glucanotransferase [Chitinophagaceae bacterium]|nr:4-alpha-glucanotransferase [Chitinophagaceae bacterium]MCW5904655.1 4-alpha-glucanotransferase [Chitinophagaceae bacterium]